MSSGPTPQPRPPQVAAPQPAKRNVLLWVLAFIGGALILLIVLSLAVGAYFLRHARFDQSGKKIDIETPAGSIRVNAEGPHHTGLPVYPGATRVDDQGANVDISSKGGSALGVTAETYSTGDDLEKVTAWYAQKLGPNFRREDDNEHKHSTHGIRDAEVSFVDDRGEGGRVVALKRSGSGVEIVLLRLGPKETQ